MVLGRGEKTVKAGKGKNEGDKRNTSEEEGEKGRRGADYK